MKYQPKRSSKRWMEGAPDYVLACYDSGPKDLDRYTVLFGGKLWEPSMGRTVQALCMSENPTSYGGVSLWQTLDAGNRKFFGRHVRWLDLPEQVREHVILRANDE